MVAALFTAANESRPSIIFIDEIDTLCRKRRDDREDTTGIQGALFTKMQEAKPGVFVIAATNLPFSLDTALLRRFKKLIYVPLPEKEARWQLLKSKFRDYDFPDKYFEEWNFSGIRIQK